jgi:hypothetical protein
MGKIIVAVVAWSWVWFALGRSSVADRVCLVQKELGAQVCVDTGERPGCEFYKLQVLADGQTTAEFRCGRQGWR